MRLPHVFLRAVAAVHAAFLRRTRHATHCTHSHSTSWSPSCVLRFLFAGFAATRTPARCTRTSFCVRFCAVPLTRFCTAVSRLVTPHLPLLCASATTPTFLVTVSLPFRSASADFSFALFAASSLRSGTRIRCVPRVPLDHAVFFFCGLRLHDSRCTAFSAFVPHSAFRFLRVPPARSLCYSHAQHNKGARIGSFTVCLHSAHAHKPRFRSRIKLPLCAHTQRGSVSAITSAVCRIVSCSLLLVRLTRRVLRTRIMTFARACRTRIVARTCASPYRLRLLAHVLRCASLATRAWFHSSFARYTFHCRSPFFLTSASFAIVFSFSALVPQHSRTGDRARLACIACLSCTRTWIRIATRFHSQLFRFSCRHFLGSRSSLLFHRSLSFTAPLCLTLVPRSVLQSRHTAPLSASCSTACHLRDSHHPAAPASHWDRRILIR